MTLDDIVGCHVVETSRRPSPYASTSPLDEIDARLETGAVLPLIVKQLGAESCEARVYRIVLPCAPDGTARCYGTITDPATDRGWLCLERIAGLELRHVGSFAMWEQAAGWAARLHRSFSEDAADRMARTLNLQRYDERYYRRWVERAVDFARADRPRHRQLLDLAGQFDASLPRLLALPRTIIHGELYASNILIAGDAPFARVCPIDWEMAASGPGLFDLAALSAGWGEPEREALAAAYCRASGMSANELPSVLADLDCCRLHLAFRMLGWRRDWTAPPQHAFDWLGEAARAAARLTGAPATAPSFV
jgi:hypothetical protein